MEVVFNRSLNNGILRQLKDRVCTYYYYYSFNVGIGSFPQVLISFRKAISGNLWLHVWSVTVTCHVLWIFSKNLLYLVIEAHTGMELVGYPKIISCAQLLSLMFIHSEANLWHQEGYPCMSKCIWHRPNIPLHISCYGMVYWLRNLMVSSISY